MPGNHSIWLDNDQILRPLSPQPPEYNPEQPIESVQLGARPLALCKPQVAAEEP
jgi:hypothetical protein